MNTKDAVSTHLRSRYQEWMSAIDRRDIEAIMAIYGDDASYLPPGKPKATGKAAIRNAWAEHLARPGFSARYEPTIVVAEGLDMAYDIGAYVIELDRDGAPRSFVGKYVVIWAMRNGHWVVQVDIDNSDS